jgi:hypothetical protein
LRHATASSRRSSPQNNSPSTAKVGEPNIPRGAQAEAAKEFMSKQSAGAALDRVSVEIADMKRDLGDRLNSSIITFVVCPRRHGRTDGMVAIEVKWPWLKRGGWPCQPDCRISSYWSSV